MVPSNQPDRRIEPEFLGPLGDRPLAAAPGSGGAEALFPGASTFLSARHQRRRLLQWSAAWPLAARLLQEDEHVIYVAPAMQIPPPLHFVALGAMALPYHQVVLIFTDRKVIEVLFGVRGMTAGTRVRSFPWTSVRDLRLRLGKLVMSPARGKKQSWKIPLRGDRSLLKMLLARLKPRLLEQGEGPARPLPLLHCPECGGVLADAAVACDSCRASFRSPRLAAILSMAFPGAGLLYAGHPFLAAGDFLGELFLYMIFLMLMLQAEPGTVMIAAGLGAFLFILTKLESVHLSRILAARTRPEPPARRSRYGRLALVGGLASLILIGVAFPLAGAARPVVDRDLEAGGPDNVWEGSREQTEWSSFKDDPTTRSQWTHPNGTLITLFAYPQGMLDDVAEFRSSARQEFLAQGMAILLEDDDVPPPFRGFRFLMNGWTEDGEPLSQVHYFILDDRNRDIHHVVAAVMGEDPSSPDELTRDLLSHAHWIDAVPPGGHARDSLTPHGE